MRPEPYRILGWIVPAICFAIATFIIFSKHAAFTAKQSELDSASLKLQSARTRKTELDQKLPDQWYASVPANSNEETQFLNDLRERMHSTGVVLMQWTSKVQSYGVNANGQTDLAGGENAALLKGITRVDCDLTVGGEYSALRQFIAGLTSSDRLFALHNINWNRSDKSANQLTFSLSRYVAPEARAAQTPKTQTEASMP
ncbi:MAG: hypothetical protein JST51_04785 [Armatimonadetes bacterium]|nr:hypothetical protein [Armatimonadota bacterium]